MNNRSEARRYRVAILNADYQIECSNGFESSDRLPIEIESKVRELMTSWATDRCSCPERHCTVAPGFFMRVFLLSGPERYRVAVTLEPAR